ncbi:NAD(+) diphosphatase [Microbacterium aureliae]
MPPLEPSSHLTGDAVSQPGADAPPEALDRAADERAGPGLVERLREAAGTRVLLVSGDAAPLRDDGGLDWTTADDAAAQGDDVHWAFLGRDRDRAALLVAVLPDDAPAGAEDTPRWQSLRAAAGALTEADAAAFVTAVSLGRWLREAPHCPACGARTAVIEAGWSRRCPDCGRQHFPRTDPAVIVAVESAARDRLLLGSNALWGADRYSCFAGFVEAGESLESAVRREVAEEAGVEVTDVRYRGSQAWPYPRSLMVGFLAAARDDRAARADGDEIVEVRWFTRDELADALGGTGAATLPGPASIAHRLISEWVASTPRGVSARTGERA